MMSCGLDHSDAMKFSTSINTKFYKLATLLFLSCPFSPLDKIRLCFLPVYFDELKDIISAETQLIAMTVSGSSY